MTKEFKQMIEELKQQGITDEQIATIEVLDQYVNNPEFKTNLEKYVFNENDRLFIAVFLL